MLEEHATCVVMYHIRPPGPGRPAMLNGTNRSRPAGTTETRCPAGALGSTPDVGRATGRALGRVGRAGEPGRGVAPCARVELRPLARTLSVSVSVSVSLCQPGAGV
jgi:hypothetical protein